MRKERRIWALYCLFLAFGPILFGQTVLDRSAWALQFAEEFEGNSSLNSLIPNWVFQFPDTYRDSIRSFYPSCGCTGSCMRTRNLQIKNGQLFLQTKSENLECNGESPGYSSAMIRSLHDDYPLAFCQNPINATPGGYLFGLFEIRCKLPATYGTYPAFWLVGNTADSEIDVFEYDGRRGREFFATHYWHDHEGPDNRGSRSDFYRLPKPLSNEFHTWTLVWTPDSLAWFVDGLHLKTLGEYVPGLSSYYPPAGPSDMCRWHKMDLIINSGPCCPAPGTGVFEDFLVDYVRVYKPIGLPQFRGQSEAEFTKFYIDTLRPFYQKTQFKRVLEVGEKLDFNPSRYRVGVKKEGRDRKNWVRIEGKE